MLREEAIAYIKNQSPSAFLSTARKKGWVCPKCGNGTGKSGDGIVRNPKDGRYICFKCHDVSGDIFDLIGHTYGLDQFNDQLHKALEIYGLTIDQKDKKNSNSNSQSQREIAQSKIKSVTNKSNNNSSVSSDNDVPQYLMKCHEKVGETSFFTGRGITKESIDYFQLGYDSDFSEGTGRNHWKAAIIPTSSTTYEARNVDVAPNSAENGGNKYRKHGRAVLFNAKALFNEKEKPIFVVEGVIDAISIIQSGGQAIGLGSASNTGLLLQALDKIMPKTPLVLALDADEAGANATLKLQEELQRLKVVNIAPKNFYENYHDANDYLLRNPVGLQNAIKEIQKEIANLENPEEVAKDEYLKTSASKALGSLREMISLSATRPRLSTGFEEIDNVLDGGIYTGLYIIGAISSLGKTTLTLQIADNLAKQGMDVLFFSLEQSRYELMAKSISRETYMYCINAKINIDNAKSNLGILDGRRWAKYSEKEQHVIGEAFSRYEEYASHLFIYEGIGNISVAEIKEKVKKHISITGNKRPIIIIDYLQILKAADGDERATDKQIVDHNVTALKQLSRDYDIPVFAVSSLNRQNYAEEINMAAFKESGAIEYGSDVLIGLQLTGSGEKGFDVKKAKEKNPRDIDFCILKNRNGKICYEGVKLIYYPMFNCFFSTKVKEKKKQNENKEDFVKIEKDSVPVDDNFPEDWL